MFLFNGNAIPNIACTLFLVCLGYYAYFANKSKVTFLFSCLTLSAAVWQGSTALVLLSGNSETAFLWTKISYMGVTFIPVTMFHFVVNFLNIEKYRKYIAGCYFVALFLFIPLTWLGVFLKGVYQYSWGYWFKATQFHPFYTFSYSLLFFINLFILYSACRKKQGSNREKIKYMLVALLISYGGALDYLADYGIDVYPVGYIFVVVCLFVIGYAIIKYRLMDIKIAVTRAGIFAVVYSLVLGIPFLIGNYAKGWVLPTLFMLFLATLGPIIYTQLRKKAEGVIFKQQLLYQTAIKGLAREMASIKESGKLLNTLNDRMNQVVKPDFIGIYVFSKREQAYNLRKDGIGRSGLGVSISKLSTLVEVLNKIKTVVFVETVKGMGGASVPHETIAIPFFVENRLYAFLVMGPKKDKVMYNSDDISVFDILSNHASLAVENSLFWEGEKTRMAREEQIRRQKAMDHFSSAMAHEIHNPVFGCRCTVTKLKMILDDVKNKQIPHEDFEKAQEEGLGQIDEGLLRVSNLITAVKEFSGQTKGEYVKLKGEDVVNGFLTIMKPQLKHEQIILKTNIKEGIKLNGNKIHLEEVLVNLASNAIHAIKYNKEQVEKGKVSVALYRKSDKKFIISVEDNGYGISKGLDDDIFTDFVTTKASTEGTGMGLSRSRKIIENHKGRIWFESDGEGKGSIFYIELPEIE
ncbi:MAG: GHKL domain-containing protein [Candidatus Omnitrophica bacterium]|nr:GHKL domain-containing protein [Candidatus Omnitrophota bacterium]